MNNKSKQFLRAVNTLKDENGYKSGRVFIVEDDGIIAYSLSANLRKYGFEVVGVARSGEEALEQILSTCPHLVLADIHLSGGMDGIELAQHVRDRFDIPLIYLTALSDKDTVRRAHFTDPSAYLAKPVPTSTLAASIRTALRKHRVDNELRRALGYLTSILTKSGDRVVVVNKEGNIEFLNGYAEHFTKKEAGLDLGRPVTSIIAPLEYTCAKRLTTLIVDAIDQECPAWFSLDSRSPDHEVESCSIRGEITPCEDGCGGAVITFRTVTQALNEGVAKYLDNNIIRCERRLQISTPMDTARVVNGSCGDVLNCGFATDPLRLPTRDIIEAAEAAADLTRKLVRFNGTQRPKAQIVHWTSIIRSHERVCRHLLGQYITLSTVLDPHVWPVRAEPTALGELLIHLVTNSRESMLGEGEITVRTSNVARVPPHSTSPMETDYVLLAVEERCGGRMGGRADRHVSEAFVSAETLCNEMSIGLSIAQELIQEVGGHIDVESTRPSGPAVEVYIPRAKAEPQEMTTPSEKRSYPSGKSLIVVDDDPAVRRVLVSILLGEGYRVAEAESGIRALELTRQQNGTIDVLITDVMMPGMSGPELSASMASMYPNLKTLFVSGYGLELSRGSACSSDDACVLPKPFSRTKLLGKVQTLLNGVGQPLPKAINKKPLELAKGGPLRGGAKQREGAE